MITIPLIAPVVGAALIAAGSAITGATISAFSNHSAQKKANEANKKLADEQYARSKRDIALQNAYNSPAAQVVRLRAAGLSPSMFYGGNGSAVAGEQNSVPDYDRSEVIPENFDFGSIVSSTADLANASTGLFEKKADIEESEKRSEKLAQDMAFDVEHNKALLAKAKNELEMDEIEKKKLQEEYERAKKENQIKDIDIERMSVTLDVDKFQLMKSIMMFPKELRAMDDEHALKWLENNRDDQRVQLAFAGLLETIRHNKQSESISRESMHQAYDMFEKNRADRIYEYETSENHRVEMFNSDQQTRVRMFNASEKNKAYLQDRRSFNGLGGVIDDFFDAYFEWNKP